jgi:hypothetical protein
VLPQGLDGGPGHDVALLVDPDPAHAQGGAHEGGRIAGVLGPLSRIPERRAGVREPTLATAKLRLLEYCRHPHPVVAHRGHLTSLRGVPCDGTSTSRL